MIGWVGYGQLAQDAMEVGPRPWVLFVIRKIKPYDKVVEGVVRIRGPWCRNIGVFLHLVRWRFGGMGNCVSPDAVNFQHCAGRPTAAVQVSARHVETRLVRVADVASPGSRKR